MLTVVKVEALENAAAMLALFEANRFVGVKNARRALAQGPCDLWLARKGEKLVGALISVERTCEDGARRGAPENCLVDASCRGEGIARQLLEAAEHHYGAAGLEGMEFAVRRDFEANRALLASGYAVVREYTRDKEDWEGNVIRNQERLLIRKSLSRSSLLD